MIYHLTSLQQNRSSDFLWLRQPNHAFKQERGHICFLLLHRDYSLALYDGEHGQSSSANPSSSPSRRWPSSCSSTTSVPYFGRWSITFNFIVDAMAASIHIPRFTFDSSAELQPFWDCLHSFFLRLITQPDQSVTLPKDTVKTDTMCGTDPTRLVDGAFSSRGTDPHAKLHFASYYANRPILDHGHRSQEIDVLG
jgi:hypothetical protein